MLVRARWDFRLYASEGIPARMSGQGTSTRESGMTKRQLTSPRHMHCRIDQGW
jgi:hypothetical protein